MLAGSDGWRYQSFSWLISFLENEDEIHLQIENTMLFKKSSNEIKIAKIVTLKEYGQSADKK